MQYTGTNGTKYETIEPPIGKGGEGSVYKIKGMPGSVLKVYKENNRTETRHRKLRAMITSSLSSQAMQQVAWPSDVVYLQGQFVGYVMPMISNIVDLNVMYSDRYTCTFTERITIAKNLCAAINSVHNAGQVCGDLNPKNIGVNPRTARITLVDTDSYHITDKNTQRIYRCEVGLPEYLPREIQLKMKNGSNLANASLPTFTKDSDHFALAVHIFALLMNGCHPFACAIKNNVNINLALSQPSVACPQPIENICNGFFPFYMKKSGIDIPKYAPEFDMLPIKIRQLFIKAFVNGHSDPKQRPDAVEWYNALEELENNVKVCKVNKLHIYPKNSSKCPWCEIENRLNPPSQPVISQKSIIIPARTNNVAPAAPVVAKTSNTLNTTAISTTAASKPDPNDLKVKIPRILGIVALIVLTILFYPEATKHGILNWFGCHLLILAASFVIGIFIRIEYWISGDDDDWLVWVSYFWYFVLYIILNFLIVISVVDTFWAGLIVFVILCLLDLPNLGIVYWIFSLFCESLDTT